MREVAQAQAAIFLRRGNPVQAQFPHPRPQVARKRVVAVDLRGARSDLVLGEGPGAVTDHRGALAEIEVEGTGRVGDHGRGAERKAEETTLCGIGDAVQPFAATFAQALERGMISESESRLFRGMRRHFRPTAGRSREGDGSGAAGKRSIGSATRSANILIWHVIFALR